MKFFENQAQPLLISTLKLIFSVPNTTQVERYVKNWMRHSQAFQKSSTLNQESMYNDILKLNRLIQAEWFRGTHFSLDPVPLQYHDRFLSLTRSINPKNESQGIKIN